MTRTLLILSYSLAAVLAASSLGGILLPGVYGAETPSWGAQGLGQDWVNLVLVAPLLAFWTHQASRGRKLAYFLLGGTYFYLVYSYVLYAFYMHFNRLYFLYIAGLGLSVHCLILLGAALFQMKVDTWFDRGRPTRLPAAYLFLVALAFYLLWLSEDLPAFLSGTAPPSLASVGLISNPVHILDLGVVLPAMAAASVQLWRKRPFGYFFFPVVMVFSIVMAAALLGMALAMKVKGVAEDLTLAYVFAVLFIADSWVLGSYLKTLKRTRG